MRLRPGTPSVGSSKRRSPPGVVKLIVPDDSILTNHEDDHVTLATTGPDRVASLQTSSTCSWSKTA